MVKHNGKYLEVGFDEYDNIKITGSLYTIAAVNKNGGLIFFEYENPTNPRNRKVKTSVGVSNRTLDFGYIADFEDIDDYIKMIPESVRSKDFVKYVVVRVSTKETKCAMTVLSEFDKSGSKLSGVPAKKSRKKSSTRKKSTSRKKKDSYVKLMGL